MVRMPLRSLQPRQQLHAPSPTSLQTARPSRPSSRPWYVLAMYSMGVVALLWLAGSAVRPVINGYSQPSSSAAHPSSDRPSAAATAATTAVAAATAAPTAVAADAAATTAAAGSGPLRTEWHCLPLEKGNNGQTNPNFTTCEFSNLVLWAGQLYVIDPEGSTAGQLPNINVDWFTTDTLPLAYLRGDLGSLPEGAADAQVVHMPTSVIAGLSFYHNFYHAFAEYAPALHSLVCRVWGDCTFKKDSDLLVVMSNRPHIAEHHHHEPVTPAAMQCVTGRKVLHLWHPEFEGKVVVFDKVLAGFGPECRADQFHCMPWEQRRPPSKDIMTKWRARVAQCIGFDDKRVAPVDPIRIVIIDRPYEQGRHFINIDLVLDHIRTKYGHVAEVAVEYLDHKSMQEQAAIYNAATIVVWIHGAAMGNLIYTPENSVGLQVVFMPTPQALFAWPEELVRDLPHNVTLKHMVNRDPERLILRAGWVRLGDTYKRLTSKEKLAVWEQKQCPTAYGEEVTIECDEFWIKISHVLELDIPMLDEHLEPLINYFAAQKGKPPPHKRALMQLQQNLG